MKTVYQSQNELWTAIDNYLHDQTDATLEELKETFYKNTVWRMRDPATDLPCRHKVELRGRAAKKPLLERMFTEASRDMLKP